MLTLSFPRSCNENRSLVKEREEINHCSTIEEYLSSAMALCRRNKCLLEPTYFECRAKK